MSTSEILFFVLILLTLYSFFIYQTLLLLISKLFSRVVEVIDIQPQVTLIISVYNEESVIRQKLENSLKLDYPRGKLEILVVSDSSTDKTDEIIKEFADQGVVLIRNQKRQGKTAGLNAAMDVAKGEIIVFTDADSFFDEMAVIEMARLYSDPEVGAVTGSTEYVSYQNGKMVATTSMYTRLERLTKRLESSIGSCVGADGAIFSIRKSLYMPLNDDDINDLVIPLNVVKQGYRVIYSDKVFCSEEPSDSASSAFSRQARITTRTLRALFRRLYLLNFIKYPFFSFELLSHKYIRLSVPLFLLILLPLNYLLLSKSIFYVICFIGQILLYLSVVAGSYLDKRGQSTGALFIPYHFIMVQISILKGWMDLLMGVKRITWEPRK